MMNPPPQFFTGYDDNNNNNNRPSPRKELQGPRPPSLKVNKDSYKIRKPPIVPQNQQPNQNHNQQSNNDDRQPVIIYAVSPKVIHTTVNDFMNLVQRLTGNTTTSTSGPGDLSPAARLASIDKTSPKIPINTNTQNDIMGDLLTDVEGGNRLSGILSPAPGSLRPISPGFFSPDPFNIMSFNSFNTNNNMFVPSPSNLFSAPIVSPSSTDFLMNSFFDF